MIPSTHIHLLSAMRDAAVVPDARGLMPLEDARRVVAALTRFERGDTGTHILGADVAWAALMSLADVDEFVRAATRLTWRFHVRGMQNVAPVERYGPGILPWIASAVSPDGVLLNVPGCLFPCLLEIDSPDALTVALATMAIDNELPSDADEGDAGQRDERLRASIPSDLDATLEVARAWVMHALSARLPLVAAVAEANPRARRLLERIVQALGPVSASLLAAWAGSETVAAALGALGIALPEPDPEIEAALAGLPTVAVAEGPVWSVTELDGDSMFPYWNVLDGYETPYAIRVSGFAHADGDVLVVQRVVIDQRGSEVGTRFVTAYGPGATRVPDDIARTELIASSDIEAQWLGANSVVIDGLTEVAHASGDADAWGVPRADAYVPRRIRNPMPLEAAIVAVAGHDVMFAPQLPASWREVALRVAGGDAERAEAMLRTISREEGIVIELGREQRALILLNGAELLAAGAAPEGAVLVFEIDDPELPAIFMDRPPSKVAPWPLMCEALRRRRLLDPTSVPQVDVLARRLAWSFDRCGPDDLWGPELHPCAGPPRDGPGVSAFTNELIARGWPHGVRLLHQHPHHDQPAAVFDWIVAQPTLPLRSYWPREIAARFVRFAGADPAARDKGGWIDPEEAARIVAVVLQAGATRLGARGAEHVTLLLEAFLGARQVVATFRDALAAIAQDARADDRPDGFHAVMALGWVARRALSREAQAALTELAHESAKWPPDSAIGRALDLALHGSEGARRSARTPEEWALADDATPLTTSGAGPLPLDIQFVVSLGECCFDLWDAAAVPASEREWFASELDLLAHPRARALAAALGPVSE